MTDGSDPQEFGDLLNIATAANGLALSLKGILAAPGMTIPDDLRASAEQSVAAWQVAADAARDHAEAAAAEVGVK